ncbi:uncharacterized protein HaLaN_05865 [Haematococcus lacustris]|uniref:Uncharacterized protein n=1 Tax=Haematococcus lacustris TaxID=44745 RepID=A0A699YS13_HAELA|nr:uncharacterized protein HaLaN_05865 [Haematococcus lacustris]
MKSLHSSSGSSSSDQTQGGDDWQAIELLSALRFDRWPAMAGLQAGLLPDRLQDSASHHANEQSGVSSPDQSLMEHPTLDLDTWPSRLQPAALVPSMAAPLATSSGSDGGGRGSQAGWSQDDPVGQGGARDEEAGGAAGGDEEGGSDKGWAALTTWLRSNLHQPRTAKRQILFVGHQQADTRQWHFHLNPNLSWCDVLPETKLRLRTLDQEVVMAFRAKYPTRPEHEWRRKCQRYRPPGATTAIDVPMGDLASELAATLDGSTTASSRLPTSHQRPPLTASGNNDPSADPGNTSQPQPVAAAATTPGSGVDTDAPLLQQQYPAPYLPAWSHVLPQQPALQRLGHQGQ